MASKEDSGQARRFWKAIGSMTLLWLGLVIGIAWLSHSNGVASCENKEANIANEQLARINDIQGKVYGIELTSRDDILKFLRKHAD